MRENYTLPPTTPPPLRVGSALKVSGWIILWTQLVLALVAGGVLVFYASFGSNSSRSNVISTGFGLFFAVCGLITLAISIFFAYQFTRFGQRLSAETPTTRPSKPQTIRLVRQGLLTNMLGMVLTLMGAQAIVGSILAIALSQPQGWIFRSVAAPIVQPFDLFVVQANINAITAHFIGIAINFWLFNRVRR